MKMSSSSATLSMRPQIGDAHHIGSGPRAGSSSTTISSLGRGLSVVDAFTASDAEISIGELSRRTGFPKTTTHRLVGDLVRSGILERSDRGFRLGVKLFELGHLAPVERKLREHAVPYAHGLSEATNLTTNVAVRDGVEIVFIEKVTRRSLHVPHSRVGGRLPMHCTALGKAILAFSSPSIISEVLASGLPRVTPKTLTDAQSVLAELSSIRRNRVAYDLEESHEHIFCIAAPVFGANEEVVGAISTTGATGMREAHHFAPAVLATAAGLSRELRDGRPRRSF